MKRTLILLVLTIISFSAWSQKTVDSVYTEQKLNRTLNFAQLTLGGDVFCATGGNRAAGGTTSRFGAGFQPRFTIGGLHFWGHADFYVTFPLLALNLQQPDFGTGLSNTEGVETGMKIYPWAIRPGRVRPFIGISFQPYSFQYRAKELPESAAPARYDRFISPVQAGLTFATRKLLFTAGARYNWRRTFNYFDSPTEQVKITLNPVSFNVGITRYIDTDKGMGSQRAVRQLNIKHHILEINNRLDSWYWGIGPSSALQMSRSSYFEAEYPYLDRQTANSFLVPDLSFGRYFSKMDMNIGVSARTMTFKTKAFDTKIRMQRHTVGLEAYKFLFDYHGFVPFVGPIVSMEYLNLAENGVQTAQVVKPAAGIVFGWDIRVTQTGTSLLRTNLRYVPGLHLDAGEGRKVMFNHLEFNFIQYVTFIGRKKLYRRYAKK